MKKLVLMVLLAGLAGVASANCGNDNGNGNGCSGNTGPQGPQGNPGLNGTNGTNGSNGANGSNGVNGKDGLNGKDGVVRNRAAMLGGLQIRLFDTRYVSMFAFDDYEFDARRNHDVMGPGARNNAYGARLVFKIGRDYTEDRIDQLEKKIKRLEALVK